MTITKKSQFDTNADGTLVCIHRDLTCCSACADAHEEVTEVFGAHYWIADPAERALYV